MADLFPSARRRGTIGKPRASRKGAIVLAAAVLAVVLSVTPGEGLGLSAGPNRSETSGVPAPEAPPAPSVPVAPVGVAAIAGAAVALAAKLRGGGHGAATRSPVVVFIAGHGNASAEATFSDVIAMMGLDWGDARFFDYRWATGQSDAKAASEDAPIDDVVDALTGFLAGVSAENRPIYVVGFSKGAAAVALMLAGWDEAPTTAIAGVTGAVLLEPPIAGGLHGDLQSLGRSMGFVPDDGGYDPMVCSAGLLCRDSREHLGKAAGVAVTVVRNPKAGVTTFGDHPEGLAVYSAPDEGPDFWETLFLRPWDLPGRLSGAHGSVLHSQEVADCVVAEIDTPGTCQLPVSGRQPGWLIGDVPGTRGGTPGIHYVV